MKVAICDDNTASIDDIIENLEPLSEEGILIECDRYLSGEELLKEYILNKRRYDMVFIDIELKQCNGIKTAEQLREIDHSFELIYVTGHEKYVFDCFKTSPAAFVIKPFQGEKLRDTVRELYIKIIENNKTVTLRRGQEFVRIEFKNIESVEYNSHKITVRMPNRDEIEFNSASGELQKRLADRKNFAACHRSFMINMDYISELRTDEVLMCSGNIVPISRNTRTEFRARYADYYVKEILK